MPNNGIEKEIAVLKRRINELEAAAGTEEEFVRAVESEPYGLDRLRRVKRKEDYPRDEEEKKQ